MRPTAAYRGERAAVQATQRAERPEHHSPWHVLESLELGEWIDALDPALDSCHVETVLRVGIRTVRDILDPDSTHDD